MNAITIIAAALLFASTAFAPAVKVVKKPVVRKSVQPESRKVAKPVRKPVAKSDGWKAGCVTTYSQKFEGRKCASGVVFRHSNRDIACKVGKFGTMIELRYGRNGRSICRLSDRGGLPLHRTHRPQFDVSRKVARELGLYRKTPNGKTDRNVRWRFLGASK